MKSFYIIPEGTWVEAVVDSPLKLESPQAVRKALGSAAAGIYVIVEKVYYATVQCETVEERTIQCVPTRTRAKRTPAVSTTKDEKKPPKRNRVRATNQALAVE